MKFGKVDNPGEIDFTLPTSKNETSDILKKYEPKQRPKIHIGCAKWNRQDLKGFYPRGTKDELQYYSRQFNSIELNATFYRIFPPDQVRIWKEKTPDNFHFFPKVPQIISQFRRLKNVDDPLNEYLAAISEFGEKLGIIFLQMHPNFSPKSFDVLQDFVIKWPREMRLAVELRHPEWYANETVFGELCQVLEENNITHIITDTAGRRDLIHMRLTSPFTFIRYTGANHESDYTRLDDWFEQLKKWIEQGAQEINFFVHQNLEKASPLLSAYLIKRMNEELGYDLIIPEVAQ